MSCTAWISVVVIPYILTARNGLMAMLCSVLDEREKRKLGVANTCMWPLPTPSALVLIVYNVVSVVRIIQSLHTAITIVEMSVLLNVRPKACVG